jgi:flagellar biogenesis protein FliO
MGKFRPNADGEHTPVINDRVLLSLRFVALIVVGAIWLMRLNDKVDRQEERIKQLEKCARNSGCSLGREKPSEN